jgi:hypothetical protein
MSIVIDNPEKAGEIAGRRAGEMYQNAAACGVLADVRAKLPLRIPEARIEAQCMVATDCPQTQSAGRFWLSFYDALEAHFPSSEGDKPQ